MFTKSLLVSVLTFPFQEFRKDVDDHAQLKKDACLHAHHMLKMKKVNTLPIQAELKAIENKWTDLEHELPRLQEDIHQDLVSINCLIDR